MRVEDFERQLVLFGDARPVVNTCSAERIDRELERRAADDIEVDDVRQIGDVGGDVVVAVGLVRRDRFGVGGSDLLQSVHWRGFQSIWLQMYLRGLR